jgi:type II secretion system protein H
MKARRDTGRAAGFTLIELLMVVLVLAIVAAIVIPNMGSAAGGQAISAARILQGDLETARSLALMTQQPYSVVFSPDQQSYKVVVNYAGDVYAATPAVADPVTKGKWYEITLGNMNGMDSVVVTQVDFGDTHVGYVTFQSQGNAVSSGSVTLRAGNTQMVISVEALTGIVTVTRTSG